jgi:N-acetylglucosamine-6-phosphate deacetylase
MADTLIKDARWIDPGVETGRGDLRLADGRVWRAAGPSAADADIVDAAGRWLTPGLIDLHTHGIGTVVYASGASTGLAAASRLLARFGTTTVLPTVVPRAGAAGLDGLDRLARAIADVSAARMPGLHLEGPFMAHSGAACAVQAGDTGLLEEILAACGGRALVMSVSPETPDILPVIERLCARNVAVFLTHTAADVAQTQAAIDAGARHATHFYDVFDPPPVTDPGVRPVGAVEVILADPRVTVDFIADGCHVHPAAIRMACAAKGCGGVCAITDSNIGAGLPPGEHETPWGFRVVTRPGDGARIAPGHPGAGGLAGSALTLNVGMANLLDWIAAPIEQIWAMGTRNPATVAGLNGAGRLADGSPADCVLWNADWTAAATWVNGARMDTGADCVPDA